MCKINNTARVNTDMFVDMNRTMLIRQLESSAMTSTGLIPSILLVSIVTLMLFCILCLTQTARPVLLSIAACWRRRRSGRLQLRLGRLSDASGTLWALFPERLHETSTAQRWDLPNNNRGGPLNTGDFGM